MGCAGCRPGRPSTLDIQGGQTHVATSCGRRARHRRERSRRAARVDRSGRAGHHRGSAERPGQRRRMADVRPRLPQSALQPARPDHAGRTSRSCARSGRSRPAASSPGSRRRRCSATACSTSRPTIRACSRSTPEPAPALVVRARIRGGARGDAVLRPGQPRRRAQGRSGLRQHPGRPALCAEPRRRHAWSGSRRSTTGRRR